MAAQIQGLVVVVAGHTRQTAFAQFWVVPQFLAHFYQFLFVGDMFFSYLLFIICRWVARITNVFSSSNKGCTGCHDALRCHLRQRK